MGMDYKYSGSASYPRFEEEVEKIAKLFGGVPSKEFKDIKEKTNKLVNQDGCLIHFNDIQDLLSWGCGSFYKAQGDIFIFPENTNKIFVKFFNNPHDSLSVEETKIVYDILKEKRDDVEKISHQLMYEFDHLIFYNDYWDIT